MSEQNYIDINDLGLEEEPLGEGFDASANAFAGPPPLPKGTYTVKAAFRNQDPTQQFQQKEYNPDKTGGKTGRYYATRLVLTVVSPEDSQGRKIFDDFVSTGVWRDDTSTIASILHLLGRGDEVAKATSHEDLCRSFSLAMAAEPLLRVSVDWQGRVKNEETGQYDDLYKTMTEFKQREDGTYDPSIKDADGKEIGKARLKVKRYFAAPQGAQAATQ